MIKALFFASRPLNVLMTMALVAASYGLAGDWDIDAVIMVVALCATCFLTAGQTIFNDAMDVAVDRVNRPYKAIVSAQVSHRSAWWIGVTMTVASVLLSAWLGTRFCLLFIGLAIALTWYSCWLKAAWGLFANVVCAAAPAALCFAGWALTGESLTALALCGSVFFASLGRQIVKDIQDLEGDALFRKRSLPMVIGESKAMYVALSCILLQISLSYLPMFLGVLGPVYGTIVTLSNVWLLIWMWFHWPYHASSQQAYAWQTAVKGVTGMYLVGFFVG